MKTINEYIYTTGYMRAHQAYDELFRPYAWPGGYPILFTDDHGDILCAECAKKYFIMENSDITADIYYEGPILLCDDCNREIESAYGDPEESESCQ